MQTCVCLYLYLTNAVCNDSVHRAVIYLVDISECPDFNTMYELYDPCTVMFFFRNKVGNTPEDVPRRINEAEQLACSTIGSFMYASLYARPHARMFLLHTLWLGAVTYKT